jgi:hypothetical protein
MTKTQEIELCIVQSLSSLGLLTSLLGILTAYLDRSLGGTPTDVMQYFGHACEVLVGPFLLVTIISFMVLPFVLSRGSTGRADTSDATNREECRGKNGHPSLANVNIPLPTSRSPLDVPGGTPPMKQGRQD